MTSYDVSTIDLDWRSMKHHEDQPNSGIEILAEQLSEGWEVIAVWWEGGTVPGSRALLKRTSQAEAVPRRSSSDCDHFWGHITGCPAGYCVYCGVDKPA